ncbi:DNA polymerase III subunit delta [Prochlorococcus sp. MIT 1223]|uniref:DNA polymerase III subunit delta n=1 Tax=Prochlorococcus sp. MIT 1223 TaxID=3096217 RepID=UPI002A75AB67|nr:DNA polymerase III subunit delta [Prochlorococcus sp. MIT 1223]
MPIHLIWGDDSGSRTRAIEKLITNIVDPAWHTMNISRLNGNDIEQANKALEDARVPPFGNGCRVVLVQKSPFCNGCQTELAQKFEEVINVIPESTHLLLIHDLKPDGRLKTTKILKKLIQSNKAHEKSFNLPAIWDSEGQKQLVRITAKDLGMKIEEEAIISLVEAIGNDSSRLISELEKISLLQESKEKGIRKEKNNKISLETVNESIEGITTNSFQVGESLLKQNVGEALIRINALLISGEPALRLLASLTTQIRGWLWVSLLEKNNHKDVAFIAKTAGIANPKRIYVIRKQIQGKESGLFLNLLNCLLEIEISLKKGSKPFQAFQDGLLTKF